MFYLLSKASAQISTELPSAPLQIESIGDIVGFALNVITGIGWSLAFIYFALGFIKYITSKGEKNATQEAQQMITYAVIGGIGLLLLGAFMQILKGILGEGVFTNYNEFIPGGTTSDEAIDAIVPTDV